MTRRRVIALAAMVVACGARPAAPAVPAVVTRTTTEVSRLLELGRHDADGEYQAFGVRLGNATLDERPATLFAVGRVRVLVRDDFSRFEVAEPAASYVTAAAELDEGWLFELENHGFAFATTPLGPLEPTSHPTPDRRFDQGAWFELATAHRGVLPAFFDGRWYEVTRDTRRPVPDGWRFANIVSLSRDERFATEISGTSVVGPWDRLRVGPALLDLYYPLTQLRGEVVARDVRVHSLAEHEATRDALDLTLRVHERSDIAYLDDDGTLATLTGRRLVLRRPGQPTRELTLPDECRVVSEHDVSVWRCGDALWRVEGDVLRLVARGALFYGVAGWWGACDAPSSERPRLGGDACLVDHVGDRHALRLNREPIAFCGNELLFRAEGGHTVRLVADGSERLERRAFVGCDRERRAVFADLPGYAEWGASVNGEWVRFRPARWSPDFGATWEPLRVGRADVLCNVEGCFLYDEDGLVPARERLGHQPNEAPVPHLHSPWSRAMLRLECERRPTSAPDLFVEGEQLVRFEGRPERWAVPFAGAGPLLVDGDGVMAVDLDGLLRFAPDGPALFSHPSEEEHRDCLQTFEGLAMVALARETSSWAALRATCDTQLTRFAPDGEVLATRHLRYEGCLAVGGGEAVVAYEHPPVGTTRRFVLHSLDPTRVPTWVEAVDETTICPDGLEPTWTFVSDTYARDDERTVTGWTTLAVANGRACVRTIEGATTLRARGGRLVGPVQIDGAWQELSCTVEARPRPEEP
ncbi:MAG: hypothetical protein H6722_13025 [Sandaracinus sp.]|nr:hypothetical protein [Sandaracinus sp.]MCB9613365.1 hypothetical protein [Sandaracinus sp.]MCB9625189.1 hypothetical protein [Sandaracinus sp.]